MKISDKRALDELAEFLDGRDWNNCTVDIVLDLIEATGRKIKRGIYENAK